MADFHTTRTGRKLKPEAIILKGRGIRKEAKADGSTADAITPGHLLQHVAVTGAQSYATLNSIDKAYTVKPHATDSGHAQKMFAVEADLLGYGIDDAYDGGDRVYYEVMERGAEIYALVAASAPAIVAGDVLGSKGDGTLKKIDATAATVVTGGDVAIALEDIDNSSNSASTARIRVEVL